MKGSLFQFGGLDCIEDVDGTCSPDVKWFGGTMGSGEDGGEGVGMHVEFSEAVTPVERDTLDGVWMISSSLT